MRVDDLVSAEPAEPIVAVGTAAQSRHCNYASRSLGRSKQPREELAAAAAGGEAQATSEGGASNLRGRSKQHQREEHATSEGGASNIRGRSRSRSRQEPTTSEGGQGADLGRSQQQQKARSSQPVTAGVGEKLRHCIAS